MFDLTFLNPSNSSFEPIHTDKSLELIQENSCFRMAMPLGKSIRCVQVAKMIQGNHKVTHAEWWDMATDIQRVGPLFCAKNGN